MAIIDTSFDFRTDTPAGMDPDIYSLTLRRYHQRLWSKSLPSGALFYLEERAQGRLWHRSALGDFFLSSDTVIPTWEWWDKAQHIIKQLSDDEKDEFARMRYSIGGMMLFPCQKRVGGYTINGERGFNTRIGDRMDLTLECIRRHYLGETYHPDKMVRRFTETLARYGDYFALFENFSGYVEFFLLQDMVTDDYLEVKFALPFDDFKSKPVPQDIEAYRKYSRNSMKFIRARNRRIDNFVIVDSGN